MNKKNTTPRRIRVQVYFPHRNHTTLLEYLFIIKRPHLSIKNPSHFHATEFRYFLLQFFIFWVHFYKPKIYQKKEEIK